MSQFKKLIRLPAPISPSSRHLFCPGAVCIRVSSHLWLNEHSKAKATTEQCARWRRRLASPRLASIARVCRLYLRDTCDATATTTERYFYHAPLPTQHHCPPPSHSVGIYILWLPLFHCCFGLFIGFHFVFLLLCLFYASEFAAFISHRTHLRRATIIGSLLGGSRELSLSLALSQTVSLSFSFHTLALAASASFPYLPFLSSAPHTQQVRSLLTLLIVVQLHLTTLNGSEQYAQLDVYPVNTFNYCISPSFTIFSYVCKYRLISHYFIQFEK